MPRDLASTLAEAPPDVAVIGGAVGALLPIADLPTWANTPASPTLFYMAGRIPAREITLLTGIGGSNKSTFGQQLATCSAAGLPMLGVDVMDGAALYVTAEDHDDRLHWMHEHLCRSLQVDGGKLAGKLFLSSIRGAGDNTLATFDAEGKIRSTDRFAVLRNTIAAMRVRLVVLDNIGHVFGGNENDRAQVTAFINLLYSLCRDFDVTLLLIGHPNKAGDSYSGSTAWLNAVRSQLVLEHPEDNPDPDARVLTVGKANYARKDEALAFRWHEFALVRDDDLPSNRLAEITAAAAGAGDNAAFLACLDARTKDGLVVSPNVSPNYAPTQFEDMPAAKNIGKLRLRKAMERLLTINEIEVFDHEVKGKGRSVKALRRAPGRGPGRLPDGVPHDPPHAPQQSYRTTPRTHSPLKGGPGGAFEAASPGPFQAGDDTPADGSCVRFPAAAEPRRGPRGEILTPTEAEPRGWLNGAGA